MAGSLAHITDTDGSFKEADIENMGDALESLEECHRIIAFLLPFAGRGMDNCDATGALAEALHQLRLPPSPTPMLYDEEIQYDRDGPR